MKRIRFAWRDVDTGAIGGGAWFSEEHRDGIHARIEEVRAEYKEVQPTLELFIEERMKNTWGVAITE